jgi:hypothetical protein
VKRFSTLAVLRSPPERLFGAMRDRLPELAESLSDVEQIEELERSELIDSVLVVNRWRARQSVPAFLQSRLGASAIHWIDRAHWFEDRHQCTWTIEPSIGEGAITCSGTTSFSPAMGGRGTRATFEGELNIDPLFLSSIVGAFQAPVKTLVESIATSIIPANFRAVAEAASKFAQSAD